MIVKLPEPIGRLVAWFYVWSDAIDFVVRRLVQAALLCFLCILCLIGLTVYKGLRANHVNQVGYTLENLNRGVTELNLSAAELRKTSATVNSNSQAELDEARAAFAAVGGAAANLGKLVTHTDVMLNGACITVMGSATGEPVPLDGPVCVPGVLPSAEQLFSQQNRSLAALEAKAGNAIDSQSATLTELQKHAIASIDALQPSLQNFAAASLTLSDGLSATLPHIAATSAHVESATGHLDGAAADVQSFIHRETSPVRGTWNIVKSFLMEVAGPAAQVATSIKP
jgi:ABC-type transporter Mla subunit MlaD